MLNQMNASNLFNTFVRFGKHIDLSTAEFH